MQVLEFKKKADDSKDLLIRKLQILAHSNPYHQRAERALLNYYAEIKASWSKSAITQVRSQYGLKLNSNRGKCFFAKIAATIELNNLQFTQTIVGQIDRSHSTNNRNLSEDKNISPLNSNSESSNRVYHQISYQDTSNSIQLKQLNKYKEHLDRQVNLTFDRLKDLEAQLANKQQQLEEIELKLSGRQGRTSGERTTEIKQQNQQLEEKQEQLRKVDRFTCFLLKHRLLATTAALNGTQESPMMRIFGSPTNVAELRSNYRQLIASEHPDFSPYSEDEAIKRLIFLRSLYHKLVENWEKFKPTAKITPKQYQKRMAAPVPWQPETFWLNIA